ncbi:MAG: peptidase S58 [Firmicutes bacterium HGW-Firmicutes-15]|nr:MAG: peptidase S58 [Firmicutes bacterium HGW-Firmicutes-15]
MAKSITDVQGITVGSKENLQALTGCTVVLTGREGAVCGVDVRGSAPGTRETDGLAPINMIDRVHAVLLSGGSAYGLDAAGGVMQYLEEHGIGHQTGPALVPIVPAAVIYDLAVGDCKVRPDKEMGYLAARDAGIIVSEGNVGAGAGATVGKIRGYDYCTKGGLGTWSVSLENGLTVGAIVVVNSFGDVINPGGEIVAGVRDDEGTAFIGTELAWMQNKAAGAYAMATNTTIAVVACNAKLDKTQMTKVAQMAHDGLARVINPIHTMCDGDTVFALCTGGIQVDVNIVGYMAQKVLAHAVLRAVLAAQTIQGYRCCKDKGL